MLLTLLGCFLLFFLTVGSIQFVLEDLLNEEYPVASKFGASVVIIVGLVAGWAALFWGARLWRRWPLVAGPLCVFFAVMFIQAVVRKSRGQPWTAWQVAASLIWLLLGAGLIFYRNRAAKLLSNAH